MTLPIAILYDSFSNNTVDPLWATHTSGSATVAETSGEARITLPSSTAGTHYGDYASTGRYNLTGDACSININTMVATGVVASAFFQLIRDASNSYQWVQNNGTLKAQKVVAGTTTDLYSVAWSLSTYQYLRIREASGTVYFDSSTSASGGGTWTNRGSTTIASAFAVTELQAVFGAQCGNVASPGSFRLSDFNPILPAPSYTWRWTDADWQLFNRHKPYTIASSGNAQGVIAIADGKDASDVLTGTVRYFAGPVGSSSGGFAQLTEYASLALAQAAAFTLPVNGRVDLPAMADCRIHRLYHRSTDGANYTLYEYVPRRIVQADDIEAESITAINIAAHTITADQIATINLDAQSRITAGAGTVTLDDQGIIIITPTLDTSIPEATIKFENAALTLEYASIYALNWATGSPFHSINLVANSIAGATSGAYLTAAAPSTYGAGAALTATSGSTVTRLDLFADSDGNSYALLGRGLAIGGSAIPGVGDLIVSAGLNVGTATGAGAGQVGTSGSMGVGVAAQSNIRLISKGQDSTSSNYTFFGQSSAGTTEFYVRNDSVGFLNNTAWNYSSDVTKKRNIRPLNKDIADFMRLDPVMFDYIDGPANRYGFIAQDVQTVIPELISTEPDGTLAMATTDLIPIHHHVLRRIIRLLVTKGVIGVTDIA